MSLLYEPHHEPQPHIFSSCLSHAREYENTIEDYVLRFRSRQIPSFLAIWIRLWRFFKRRHKPGACN